MNTNSKSPWLKKIYLKFANNYNRWKQTLESKNTFTEPFFSTSTAWLWTTSFESETTQGKKALQMMFYILNSYHRYLDKTTLMQKWRKLASMNKWSTYNSKQLQTEYFTSFHRKANQGLVFPQTRSNILVNNNHN